VSDVLVLCYHAVSPTWTAPLAVTPAQLRDHITALLARGYAPMTFCDAIAGRRSQRAMAVTFDDGYRSVMTQARPILDELGVPATVFIPTAHIDRPQPMRWSGIGQWLDGDHGDELLPLRWSEVAALADAGWEIGSHSRTHSHLPALDDRSLREELDGSRADCVKRLGRPCRSVAYPYGEVDERVARAASAVGYEAGAALWSTRPRPSGALRWPRVEIYRSDHRSRFALKVSTAVRTARATPLWAAAPRGVWRARLDPVAPR
jgi:peptidoglycan/xylan/chitin deacetylase (PgdA/CDA1 family)